MPRTAGVGTPGKSLNGFFPGGPRRGGAQGSAQTTKGRGGQGRPWALVQPLPFPSYFVVESLGVEGEGNAAAVGGVRGGR